MDLLLQRGGRFSAATIALALGVAAFSGTWSAARGGDHFGGCRPSTGPYADDSCNPIGEGLGFGTLGYGPPGLFPGFPGFGLSFHLGYGYGGCGRGVGAEGGYPYYGGPGYPHGEPPLRRCGGISRTTFFGGSGGFEQLAGGIGPGYPPQAPGNDPGSPDFLAFGYFTGGPPDPERFGRYAAEAAATGSFDATRPGAPTTTTPSPPPATPAGPGAMRTPAAPAELGMPPVPGRYLGIDEEPATDAEGVAGIKIIKVYPGTSAERAGLQPGDVIHSINGYQTVRRGNLAWIIANRAFGNVLTMTVRTAADGKVHVITVSIPGETVNTVRPPYLPPVGNGPPPASR